MLTVQQGQKALLWTKLCPASRARLWASRAGLWCTTALVHAALLLRAAHSSSALGTTGLQCRPSLPLWMWDSRCFKKCSAECRGTVPHLCLCTATGMRWVMATWGQRGAWGYQLLAAEGEGYGSAKAAGDGNHWGECKEGRVVSSRGQLVLNHLAKRRRLSV